MDWELQILQLPLVSIPSSQPALLPSWAVLFLSAPSAQTDRLWAAPWWPRSPLATFPFVKKCLLRNFVVFGCICIKQSAVITMERCVVYQRSWFLRPCFHFSRPVLQGAALAVTARPPEAGGGGRARISSPPGGAVRVAPLAPPGAPRLGRRRCLMRRGPSPVGEGSCRLQPAPSAPPVWVCRVAVALPPFVFTQVRTSGLCGSACGSREALEQKLVVMERVSHPCVLLFIRGWALWTLGLRAFCTVPRHDLRRNMVTKRVSSARWLGPFVWALVFPSYLDVSHTRTAFSAAEAQWHN